MGKPSAARLNQLMGSVLTVSSFDDSLRSSALLHFSSALISSSAHARPQLASFLGSLYSPLPRRTRSSYNSTRSLAIQLDSLIASFLGSFARLLARFFFLLSLLHFSSARSVAFGSLACRRVVHPPHRTLPPPPFNLYARQPRPQLFERVLVLPYG